VDEDVLYGKMIVHAAVVRSSDDDRQPAYMAGLIEDGYVKNRRHGNHGRVA
jgi:hypothetical protein